MNDRHRPPGITRRSVVTGALGTMLLAGCTAAPPEQGDGAAPPANSDGEGGSSSSPTPVQTAVPVDVAPYALLEGEVEPACKAAATTAMEAVLTWREAAGSLGDAVGRAAALGLPADVVVGLKPLLSVGAWSSLRITYPQYGGLSPGSTSASVMITADQLAPAGPDVSTRPLVVDVRLSQDGGTWTVTDLLLAETPPAAAPAPTAAAAAALSNDRIVLPGSARADLEAGIVDDVVPTTLVALAERWRLDVHVFSSGHPLNVFATDRQSNHTRGLAVDIWAIDEVPVIDQDRSAWREVMLAAAELGATEIGGPEDLDGVRGRPPHFSDLVHQDHLHLGFGAK